MFRRACRIAGYLNYLVFGQNLQLVPTGSGMVQVPQGGAGPGGGLDWTTITPGLLDGDLVRIEVPGYIVVHINNNSIGKDVYFDNIKIEHYTGTVLDDNHYYPFGLTLSSTVTASTAPAQPYKYNTKELEKSFGLEMYDYGARIQDPQLGIWHQVDPLAEQSRRWSPYNYAYDNPVRFIDPDGRLATDIYNISGSKKIHIDDGRDDKKMALTYGGEKKINNAAKEGAIIDVPTDEIADKMLQSFESGEKNQNEFGFVVGAQNQSSIIVEGNGGEVNNSEWDMAKADLMNKGDIGVYDVHLHSQKMDENGNLVIRGLPEPSPFDKVNPIYPSSDKLSIVLGYDEHIIPGKTGLDKATITYPRAVGFYDQKGNTKAKDLDFNDFYNGIKFINSQNK